MRQILCIVAIAMSILACTGEIDTSNRYTYTGETVADFLLNRSEKYSHFITMLKRADLFSLLNTYGQFTLFLPDNVAIEKYVAEQDSIYHATQDTNTPVWTGITSPLVEELSDSMANVIARTHIIESSTMIAEMGEGALPDRNFNYRFLGVNYVVKDEQYYIMLNNSAAIIGGDNQLENGVVHLVDKVVTPSQKDLPELIVSCQFFKIFASALNRTGFADSLKLDNDENWDPDQYKIQREFYGNYVCAPPTKFYKFTGFVEPDEVFHKNGIYTIDDLTAFAEKWYGTVDSDNPKSPRNALYKFVAYHFVPREMPHNKVVPYNISTNFDAIMPTIFDRYDYVETMQGTLMKFVKPLSTPEGRDTYINYNKRNEPFNADMHRHLDVRVIPLTDFIQLDEKYALFDQMATNGIVHPIDKILIYNEDEMYGNILNERIRIDSYSLLPELSCNGIRYSTSGQYVIPEVYSEKLKIRNGYIVCQSPDPDIAVPGYNCDAIVSVGNFDYEIILPPLPPRVYEVRLGLFNHGGYGTNWGDVFPSPVQVYIDGKIEGVPFNENYLDYSGYNKLEQTGYVKDELTFDNGLENDKHMRNLGWMKGPASVYYYTGIPCRDERRNVRRIVTRKYFSSGEHRIRLRYIGYFTDVYLYLDYLEFVPLHIINDPTKPEDRY